MAIGAYIKEIGRGQAGARSLSLAQSQDLMSQLLDGGLSDLEIGAFVLAMRMKGETLDELSGFLAAVQQRCLKLPSDRPVVVIPSYNGARRLPNLTPLLAMSLAQQGARVLVHGPRSDPGRVTSAEVFHDLGLPPADSLADIECAWARREPAVVPTGFLCPSLQRLLDVRAVVGLRNSGHTLAKMINPVTGARVLRLVNHTHPEFGLLMGAWAQRSGADALLLRGTEGEPVADPRRLPRLEVWLAGQLREDLSTPAQEGVLTALPLLPRERDPATTAVYIQAVLGGEKPAPSPLARQVTLLMSALEEIDAPAPARAAQSGPA